ncbi:hypothetical protein GCM10023324_52020 [Streptomyces youssoufiensis]
MGARLNPGSAAPDVLRGPVARPRPGARPGARPGVEPRARAPGGRRAGRARPSGSTSARAGAENEQNEQYALYWPGWWGVQYE